VDRARIFEQGRFIIRKLGAVGLHFIVELPAENSFGAGPTQEFFTILSTEFCKASLNLWRNNFEGEEYAWSAQGLFPSSAADEQLLYELGLLCATALEMGVTLDIPLNAAFFKLVLDKDVSLAEVEPKYKDDLRDTQGLIGLSFVDPLTGVELRPDGGDLDVTEDNVGEYRDLVESYTCGRFIKEHKIQAWVAGFSEVIDPQFLHMFSPYEITQMLSGIEAEFTADDLRRHAKVTGFDELPDMIDNFFEVVKELTAYQQTLFVKFLTGSPKLPIGGFGRLKNKIEILKRGNEVDNESLPSALTCLSVLKLPLYSSKDIIRQKLFTAIQEGNDYFRFA
jgi:E3 ubiquitin-protein ligase TRIP12